VTEELGFEELVGKGGAVDGDKRPLAPARGVMNETRHHLLAGARFPGQQDCGFGMSHAGCVRQHVLPLF
jgi:hypothetical protein